MNTVWFFRPSYLVWIAVPLLVFGAYQIYGLPHLRWIYTWRDDGQGYKPFADRYYLRCTYLGFTQSFEVEPPEGGRCPIIRFAKDGVGKPLKW